MSDQQIAQQLKTLKEATQDALKSKEAARKFLREAGIIKAGTPSSTLKKDAKK